MPGVDSLKQAVANGLGIGIVPRAAVSSLTALPDWSRSPCRRRGQPARCTLVYRDNDGQRNAVEDFVEALRCTGEDRASRKAPIAMRASR